ncbi:serine/threonine-protein kinase ULK3 [Schistocerca serialis cubense]|uniref:serine/threonine-protein kinase ULK3 n=1 Tax=Schistocerca serialis cubense TaxID=2023355 RepID=UPI00214F4F60|nr:serine/threonine-protein kinase ULK3 [Schistocerca serialis cubense]
MALPKVEGYAIVEKIGAGSYASVYKAFKKVGAREVVAVKCVDKSRLSGSAIDNLVTEISLLKVLKHKNIVEMKDFMWDERNIYIVMEYCNGGDLSCFIRKRRKLPETVCRKFLQQLAVALKFLRSHNVCHMDLKPQNLLLTSTPKLILKLADFGFAQYLSPEDYNSSLRGSPLYMAPEMLLKRHYDASVDLWSVGVIMYECLFGRAPYSSSNFKELAEKIKSEMPIEVPHGGCISDDCRDLLVRLLKHNPSERIDYESFFNHPFLDLEHMPSPESYQKAVELVQKAVKCDAEQKFSEAFDLYCESLRYFVPLVNDEDDTKKKIAFRNKVNEYIRRAEDLKTLLYEKENNCKHPKGQHTTDGTLEELMRLCATNSTMQTALEIGASAEQYLKEGQYSHALEKFQSCLGLLVPLLSSEPKGRRRDLLHTQVQQWLTQAENIKSFLNLISITDDTAALSKGICALLTYL